MIDIMRTFAALSLAVCVGGCWGAVTEHPAAQYVHRSDTITLSAGNAQEVNEATQVIDPWRRGVGDPRIPANGERMVGAVERYRKQQTPRSDARSSQPATSSQGSMPTTSGGPVATDTLPY